MHDCYNNYFYSNSQSVNSPRKNKATKRTHHNDQSYNYALLSSVNALVVVSNYPMAEAGDHICSLLH